VLQDANLKQQRAAKPENLNYTISLFKCVMMDSRFRGSDILVDVVIPAKAGIYDLKNPWNISMENWYNYPLNLH
jgi:hypothetical protein